jgi:predicted O-methyltransferase YrrM
VELPESFEWCQHSKKVWKSVLSEFAGREDVRYLEIGTYHGGSLHWMLDEVLTHPTASATAIDPFDEAYRPEFLRLLNDRKDRSKVRAIAGRSQKVLFYLVNKQFDIIYIDGDHRAIGAMTDMVLSWQLLRPGGVMIMDDFKWNSHWPAKMRPNKAIKAFLDIFENEIEVLFEDWQVIVKKAPAESHPLSWSTSSLGAYHYDWENKAIIGQGRNRPLGRWRRLIVEPFFRWFA